MLKVTHIVNSVFTSRTYILWSEEHKGYWLVDCGDVPPLLDRLSSLGGNSFSIKGVLLTHVHYDHFYGLPRLTELYPDLRVYTNDAGRSALTNPRFNMSKYHDDPIVYESGNVVVCKEGDVIQLYDSVSIRVLETPGHHPSCLTFDNEDFLFTGDAYIPGEKVVTILPGADKEMARCSLERILGLMDGKTVCPGHEEKK